MTGLAGKRRNIVVVWAVLPLLTLGVYHLVWWYKINAEAGDFDRDIEVAPLLSLLAVTIGWILIVPPFISVYRTGGRIALMQAAAGMRPTCSGWIGLVASFFLGLHTLYYQHELNGIWDHLGNPEPGTTVPLADVAGHWQTRAA